MLCYISQPESTQVENQCSLAGEETWGAEQGKLARAGQAMLRLDSLACCWSCVAVPVLLNKTNLDSPLL